MCDPVRKYKEALAAFAVPGARWATKGALTYWGKAAGLTADQIVADARAAGVHDRDADIRRGWADAKPRFMDGKPTVDYTPRAAQKPKPRPHPNYVRDLIGRDVLDWIAAEGLHAPGANPEALRELSPHMDWTGADVPDIQTSYFLRALYRPDEWIHVLDVSNPPRGVLGGNVRRAEGWLEDLERGHTLPGDGLLPNPLTGEIGTTKDNKPSLICDDCIADFPFVLIEFDDIRHAFGGDVEKGLAAQFAIWRGFVERSGLSDSLVSVVQSGKKSLHALLHVGARTREEWEAYRDRLAALFLSDPTSVEIERGGARVTVYPFRCDPAGLRPRQATRLAGARRRDNGAIQLLHYLDPRARHGDGAPWGLSWSDSGFWTQKMPKCF